MKIVIAEGSGIELVAQNSEDEFEIKRIYKLGHLHFVCKAIYTPTGHRQKRLLLSPSFQKWSAKK